MYIAMIESGKGIRSGPRVCARRDGMGDECMCRTRREKLAIQKDTQTNESS